MKNINFIKAPPPSHQHHTHRWAFISIVALCMLLVTIGIYQTKQVWILIHARSRCIHAEKLCCNSQQCINTHNSYAEQALSIAEKLKHLTSAQNSLKAMSICIHEFTQDTHNHTLKHCRITKGKASITLNIPTQTDILQLTQALSNLPITEQIVLEAMNTLPEKETLATFTMHLNT